MAAGVVVAVAACCAVAAAAAGCCCCWNLLAICDTRPSFTGVGFIAEEEESAAVAEALLPEEEAEWPTVLRSCNGKGGN